MDSIEAKELELKYKAIGQILGLFIVVNISLFVTTGLVSDFKYYFPLIALILFLCILLFVTFPKSKLLSQKCYSIIFFIVWIGIYFTGASIVYMIKHNHFKLFLSK